MTPDQSGKYSVGEYERRFLVAQVPPGASNPRRIVDSYIHNTRLRLRSVDLPGGEFDHKLGHKRRVDSADPTAVLHTSLYLNESEFQVLARLPASRLVKTRWAVAVESRTCSVDVFEESLAGLILMEVDLGGPSDLAGFVPPPWVGPEVTRTEAFTGGELAGKSLDDLRGPLAKAHERG